MATGETPSRTPLARGEEILGLLQQSQAVLRQLLQEHDQLQRQCGQLEQDLRALREQAPGAEVEALLQENLALLEKINQLEQRVAALEQENQEFATKYVEAAEQNESLANLYVASHQLHSTLDPQEVLGIVNEILINLVGAEEFAVYVVDKTTQELTPVTGEGILPRLAAGEAGWEQDILARVIATGEAFYRDGQHLGLEGPLACVPLTIKEDVVGAIAIFQLLVQKEGFTRMDSELLNLVAGHAATAIVGAHRHADAERKLKTIEGFMDLLIHPTPPPDARGPRPQRPGG